MSEIGKISHDYNIPIIEDCAHCFGSVYKDQYIGDTKWSRFAMFSFQAIKHLTTVDGGALCVENYDDYKRAKLLRWFGIDRESERTDFRCEEDIKEWGYKYHMNDVCATIGLHNISLAQENVKKTTDNARFYETSLIPFDGIEMREMINILVLVNLKENCHNLSQ
jgi:dTDP-4-amino-4,6-dideoxygalactose transaminase